MTRKKKKKKKKTTSPLHLNIRNKHSEILQFFLLVGKGLVIFFPVLHQLDLLQLLCDELFKLPPLWIIKCTPSLVKPAVPCVSWQGVDEVRHCIDIRELGASCAVRDLLPVEKWEKRNYEKVAPSAFLHRRNIPAVSSFLWPALDLLQKLHVFLVLVPHA